MIKKKNNKLTLISFLSKISIFVFSLYPILFLYFKNIIEARERHLVDVTIVYVAFSGITFLLIYLFWHNIPRTIMLTNIVSVFVCNYELIATAFVKNPFVYTLTAIIMLLIFLFTARLIKKIEDNSLMIINAVCCLTLIFLLFIDSIPAIPYMVIRVTARIPVKYESTNIIETNVETESELALNNTDEVSNRPNVYLMIFDEYGGKENLLHYFDYDNVELYNWLQEKQFNVSYSSRNEESISTVTNVPNLLNLDYVVEHETEGETYTTYIKNPYIYSFFANRGYEINTVSYVDLLDNAQSVKHYDTKMLYEDTIGYYILRNSAFIHIYDKLIAPNLNSEEFASSDHSGQYLKDALKFYKDFAETSNINPQFNLGYFSCPHVPLCYKSDGTAFPDDELESDNPENYLEYLKWTTKQICDITQTIIDNDPHSIVIIMSDHGCRMWELEEDEKLEDPYYYMKYILNCVYVDGKEMNIEGLTGINTLITILNSEFDAQIEYKEYIK